MKHIKAAVFMIACMAVCLIPSVGTIFAPTTESTENKVMASAPELLTESGSFNTEVFDEFEDWFEEHMAFRNRMLRADAEIQTKLFGVSNVSGVTYGTDGWLYYTSTLDDYQGTDILTSRELSEIAHNMSVVQTYLEERGVDFLLTVPADKNTLYGGDMPYFDSIIVSDEKNSALLKPYLEAEGVHYLDLISLFKEQEDVLYLKKDSHWSNRGALLAYNAIMDSLELPHEDYESLTPITIESSDGDLNRMLYSFYGPAESDISYADYQDWIFENGSESVEDTLIETSGPEGSGTLVMFRDSFANKLIPYFSAEFETAYYSKGQPYMIESALETYSPDCMVIEKVERNLSDWLRYMPILTAPQTEEPENYSVVRTDTSAEITACQYDARYLAISGSVPEEYLSDTAEILVSVNGIVYVPFLQNGNGFVMYLKTDALTGDAAEIRVYVSDDGTCRQVFAADVAATR